MENSVQSPVIRVKDKDDELCDKILKFIKDAIDARGNISDEERDEFILALNRGVVPKVWIKDAIVRGLMYD